MRRDEHRDEFEGGLLATSSRGHWRRENRTQIPPSRRLFLRKDIKKNVCLFCTYGSDRKYVVIQES